MYLGKPLQYYQSINNLPQKAQTFDYDLKSCCFAQHLQLLCSLLTCLRLTLVILLCLGPRLALLVVDFSPSQSFMVCVAQHFELLCLFLTCLRPNLSSFVLLNTLRRSARCGLVSTVSTFLALC